MNRKEFENLAFPLLDDLYRTARYLVGGEAEAMTLVKDSFVRAYCASITQRQIRNSRVWLFGIMINTYSRRHVMATRVIPPDPFNAKMNLHHRSSDPADYMESDSWSPASYAAIATERAMVALRELPAGLRLVFALSLQRDLSYKEIAEITELDRETVKFRLHQSRAILRDRLFTFATHERKLSHVDVTVENGRVN